MQLRVEACELKSRKLIFATHKRKKKMVADRANEKLQRENTVRWDKVPEVPRPSLVPEPYTVWGRKKPEVYQYATLPEIRGRDPASDHTRQLIRGGAITHAGLDAPAELATRGCVFETGILARKSTDGAEKKRKKQPPSVYEPASGRTRILMALQKPSWYRY